MRQFLTLKSIKETSLLVPIFKWSAESRRRFVLFVTTVSGRQLLDDFERIQFFKVLYFNADN